MVVEHNTDPLCSIICNLIQKNIFHTFGRPFANTFHQKSVVRVKEHDVASGQRKNSTAMPRKTIFLKRNLVRKPNSIHKSGILQFMDRSVGYGKMRDRRQFFCQLLVANKILLGNGIFSIILLFKALRISSIPVHTDFETSRRKCF